MKIKHIYETYEITSTATDMIYRLGRLFRYQLILFFQKSGFDITPEQWRLILKIAENEGYSQGGLADDVLNDRPNITRILDVLERKDLIRRKNDPSDRRNTLIFLTEKGKNLIDTLLPDVIEEKEKYYKGLKEKDVDELRRILSVIEANLVKE